MECIEVMRNTYNTYRGNAKMVIQGSKEYVYSREGVTLGDPLSMFMCAVGILPLICLLKDLNKWTQIWYADHASACSKLDNLLAWFELFL